MVRTKLLYTNRFFESIPLLACNMDTFEINLISFIIIIIIILYYYYTIIVTFIYNRIIIIIIIAVIVVDDVTLY